MNRNQQLLEFMAQACTYAQGHIDDKDGWDITEGHREELLQCVSYQMACFISQDTVEGREGVEWDVIIKELIEHPQKTVEQWTAILAKKIYGYGGWIEEGDAPQACEVIVGNIGSVYLGMSFTEACDHYSAYVEISKLPGGRVGGEPVTLLVGGEIEEEHNPEVQDD